MCHRQCHLVCVVIMSGSTEPDALMPYSQWQKNKKQCHRQWDVKRRNVRNVTNDLQKGTCEAEKCEPISYHEGPARASMEHQVFGASMEHVVANHVTYRISVSMHKFIGHIYCS